MLAHRHEDEFLFWDADTFVHADGFASRVSGLLGANQVPSG